MSRQKVFRLDKLFGAAALISILVLAAMVYCDFLMPSGDTDTASGSSTGNQTVAEKDDTSAADETSSGGAIVCLDAARGGDDAGLSGCGYKEKDLTLEVVKAVGAKLESINVGVVYTRETDTDVSDAARTNVSNKANADLCVSFRMNSYSADSSVTGAEAYVYTNQTDEAGILASDILTRMSSQTGIKNRGVRVGMTGNETNNYYINAHCVCTSCVVNLGFITNESDVELVTDGIDETSQAIADGITDYLKQAGLY